MAGSVWSFAVVAPPIWVLWCVIIWHYHKVVVNATNGHGISKSFLPTTKDTGLHVGETTTKEANMTVQRVLTKQSQCTGGPQTQSGTRKNKLYTSYVLHIHVHFKPYDTYFCVFWCTLFLKSFTIIILDQKRMNNWVNHIILYLHKFLALGYNNILQIILKQLYKTSSATVCGTTYYIVYIQNSINIHV